MCYKIDENVETVIEGYPNYTISKMGVVVNKKYNRQIKLKTSHKGYSTVELWNDGKRKIFMVHRLVASAFIPNPENKPQVNHLDFNRSNNNIENLEWVTAKENVHHSIKSNRKGGFTKELWKEFLEWKKHRNSSLIIDNKNPPST